PIRRTVSDGRHARRRDTRVVVPLLSGSTPPNRTARGHGALVETRGVTLEPTNRPILVDAARPLASTSRAPRRVPTAQRGVRRGLAPATAERGREVPPAS